jgi:Uncharacterized protein conserved in bacteria (DUF2188)
MPNSQNGVHVVTNPNGTGWVAQANGVILSRHHSKPTAIAKGRQLAKRHGEDLTIHRVDGAVIETRSYVVRPI